ncbi:TPA: hypothetical protein RQJ89_003281 [Vibrio vulnificus]|nr:hypothetical protein [Vibrio vulnificus]HDY7671432.1 hypothetical protein [Vibrio vulnificus]HDY7712604.1 hypothetical protein [Vibrio vulnificus]
MLNTTHHFSQVGNKVAQQHMGSTELAANLFRATIEELGGTRPEDLPTPEKGIPQLACAQKKLESDQ